MTLYVDLNANRKGGVYKTDIEKKSTSIQCHVQNNNNNNNNKQHTREERNHLEYFMHLRKLRQKCDVRLLVILLRSTRRQ